MEKFEFPWGAELLDAREKCEASANKHTAVLRLLAKKNMMLQAIHFATEIRTANLETRCAV
jgi:hypothetical protein